MLSSEIIQYKDFTIPKDIRTIEEQIHKPLWRFGHSSSLDPDANKFWSQSVESIPFFSEYLFEKIKNRTGQDFDIERIYMNGHTNGSHGNVHTDSSDPRSKTFLIYCNDTWLPDLGGGTTFICDDDNVTAYPYPYSAIYFSGNIPHFATPLSPHFKGLRVTLAYKLKLK
jgi:Rps23 Pro-64 3,4-dihydroxylase Tpa1-like proline 4-hydroxylase